MKKTTTKEIVITEKDNLNLLKKFTCKDNDMKHNYKTCITSESTTTTNNGYTTTLTIYNKPKEKKVYSLEGNFLMNSTVDYDDYNFIKHNLIDTYITLDTEIIKSIYLALELASKDDERTAGVDLTYKNGILDITSTNSYAMYNKSFNFQYNKEFSFLIPGFILKDIKTELNKFKCEIKIYFNDDTLQISYLNRNIYTINRNLSFPKYKEIIESFKKNEYIDFSNIDLTAAYEYSKKNKEKYGCKFDFNNNIISTFNYQDNIETTGTYKDVISLNLNFLQTVLKVSNKLYINNKHSMIGAFSDTESVFLMPIAMRD